MSTFEQVTEQAKAACAANPGVTYTVHPAWCDDHDGFTDGSADWHKSREVEVASTAPLNVIPVDEGTSQSRLRPSPCVAARLGAGAVSTGRPSSASSAADVSSALARCAVHDRAVGVDELRGPSGRAQGDPKSTVMGVLPVRRTLRRAEPD